MESLSDDQFSETVDRVVLQLLCTQGWLGYGNALLIGFGDHVLPPIVQGKGLLIQEQPSYRLTTEMSYWGVLDENGSIIGHSEGTRDLAESALAKIVGSEVSGLEIYVNFALDIRFSSGIKLTIRPYPQNTQPEDDLWSVREPDGFYSFVRYDGQMYRIHEHERPVETKMNE